MARTTAKTKPGIPAAKRPAAKHPKPPRIARILERLGRMIPEEELRRIPKDLSSQVDHYVYGTPKK